MVKKADVFTENFAPGAVERLGLGYDVVNAINPSIIYAQVKGFGGGSPHEKGLSFDPIFESISLQRRVTCEPELVASLDYDGARPEAGGGTADNGRATGLLPLGSPPNPSVG
jgi:hypothetical protein